MIGLHPGCNQKGVSGGQDQQSPITLLAAKASTALIISTFLSGQACFAAGSGEGQALSQNRIIQVPRVPTPDSRASLLGPHQGPL